MLDYSIKQAEGVMVLIPHAPMSKADFAGLSAAVDAYLAAHDKLRGMMIWSKDFPGREDLGGFAAHMHFVREYHKKIDRIAIVTDSALADIAESLGRHFTSVQIKHFLFADDAKALDWLETAIR